MTKDVPNFASLVSAFDGFSASKISELESQRAHLPILGRLKNAIHDNFGLTKAATDEITAITGADGSRIISVLNRSSDSKQIGPATDYVGDQITLKHRTGTTAVLKSHMLFATDGSNSVDAEYGRETVISSVEELNETLSTWWASKETVADLQAKTYKARETKLYPNLS